MAVSAELRALVDQMPAADSQNMLTEDIDKDKIEKAVAALAERGRESFVGLISKCWTSRAAISDLKPHYALHCVANHVLVIRSEPARRNCETMAAALASDRSPYIKSFLCQELQWAGRQESVAALGRVLEDPQLVEPASMALVAIGGQGAPNDFDFGATFAARDCRLHIVQALGQPGGHRGNRRPDAGPGGRRPPGAVGGRLGSGPHGRRWLAGPAAQGGG